MIRSAQATSSAAAFLPPPTVEETAWDILLALHTDQGCELKLDKLARVASVSLTTLDRWLQQLELRRLVGRARHRSSGELRAILTPAGRDLLDRYLSAAADLQVGAHN